jgi:YD repeat-containing protein
MLTKIIYPTGGQTTIEYEGNKNSGDSNYFGGVRVSRTLSIGFSQPHDDIETDYDYNNSGQFTSPFQYTKLYMPNFCSGGSEVSGYSNTCDKSIKNSNGYFNAYNSIEGSVFYNNVSEKRTSNDGKKYEIVHYYNSAPYKTTGGPILTCDMTNVNPTHFYGSAHEYKTEYYDFLYNTMTAFGVTYNIISGKRLQKRELFNYEKKIDLNGITQYSYIREIKNNTGVILNLITPQNGLFYSMIQLDKLNHKFNLSKYQIFPFWRRLKEKTTENYFYDQFNNQTSVVETINYNYTNETYINGASTLPIHHQIVEEIKTNSSNSVISRDIFRFKYPDDLSVSPYGGGLETYQSQAYLLLKRDNQHRIGTPIQIEASREEGNYNFNNDFIPSFSSRLYTQRTTYKNFGSVETIPVLVLPEIVKNSKGQLSTGEILENKLRYYRYTSTGKVLEAQKENGSIICYIYDHDMKNVIAMIENATFSQIASQLGLTITELENIAPIGYSPLAAIEGLRTTLTNGMLTTYTYNSNDQITSITDPKGDKVNYQYDIFQRLIRIIDKNGSTLSENEYHYKP